MNTRYSEVRIDFFDEYENLWCVDAWKTDDPNEDGEVVARIDDEKIPYIKGTDIDPMSIVVWNVKSAMNDEYVRETIISFIKNYKID